MKKYGSAEPIEPEVDEDLRKQAASNYTEEDRQAMLQEQREADQDDDGDRD